MLVDIFLCDSCNTLATVSVIATTIYIDPCNCTKEN